MAITDKTRKILWGCSGNRCAICRRELFMPKTTIDDSTVIGDECHIISASPNGPRGHRKLPLEEYDKPENLILLCKIHHKQVDDQVNKYTIDTLLTIKRNHEKWVSETLAFGTRRENSRLALLKRIESGKQLMTACESCLAYLFDHDEPKTDLEMEAISLFLQNSQDWREIWDNLDAGERVEACFGLSKQIAHLGEMGLWVFGTQQARYLKVTDQPKRISIFIMKVVCRNHSAITPAGDFVAYINMG